MREFRNTLLSLFQNDSSTPVLFFHLLWKLLLQFQQCRFTIFLFFVMKWHLLWEIPVILSMILGKLIAITQTRCLGTCKCKCDENGIIYMGLDHYYWVLLLQYNFVIRATKASHYQCETASLNACNLNKNKKVQKKVVDMFVPPH